jgi:hypothetical protein
MSTLNSAPVPASDGREVSARARGLAAQLAALFEQDSQIAGQLNDAQRRLMAANARLWSGLHPDAVALLYDRAAPSPHSEIVALIGDARTVDGEAQAETAVLCVLQEIHWQLHRSFCQYQSVCEQRRQLAFDVGELAQRLTDALRATGWSEQDARSADVHQLSTGPVR